MTQIGVCTSMMYNIGNIFIDFGALESLKESTDDDTVIGRADGSPSYMDTLGGPLKTLSRPVWRFFGNQIDKNTLDKFYHRFVGPSDRFSMLKSLDPEYFVFPGCLLTVPFFRQYEEYMEKLSDSGTKIIFLGAGSNSYSEFETEYIQNVLKRIEPYGFISRDKLAYDKYGHLAEHSLEGIDNAFFVDRLNLDDVRLDLSEYSVLTFDKYGSKSTERQVQSRLDTRTITTSHTPLPEKRSFRSKKPESGDFVSTSANDYLLLYANADQVHADRVHACVPALAYDNECRLYKEQLRSGIFENVTDGNITSELCSPQGLEERRQDQVQFLSEILE